MIDVIAVTSVVTSGLVAGASVIATSLNGRAQRRHEARIAYVNLLWERQSRYLEVLIGEAGEIADRAKGPRSVLLDLLPGFIERIEPLSHGIRAYTSEDCSQAYSSLRHSASEVLRTHREWDQFLEGGSVGDTWEGERTVSVREMYAAAQDAISAAREDLRPMA